MSASFFLEILWSGGRFIFCLGRFDAGIQLKHIPIYCRYCIQAFRNTISYMDRKSVMNLMLFTIVCFKTTKFYRTRLVSFPKSIN